MEKSEEKGQRWQEEREEKYRELVGRSSLKKGPSRSGRTPRPC
jgi:hypothetical protein